MCLRKVKPRPSFRWAPSTKPGISATENTADNFYLNFNFRGWHLAINLTIELELPLLHFIDNLFWLVKDFKGATRHPHQ
jgi:hypothetical protein